MLGALSAAPAEDGRAQRLLFASLMQMRLPPQKTGVLRTKRPQLQAVSFPLGVSVALMTSRVVVVTIRFGNVGVGTSVVMMLVEVEDGAAAPDRATATMRRRMNLKMQCMEAVCSEG